MKKTIPLFFISLLFLLSSCTKSWMENRLEGNWRLERAERTNLLNWSKIHTGYESGTFQFLNDGRSGYTDSLLAMNGDWRLRRVTDTYSTEEGGEQKTRMAFSVHLYDFVSQKVLNLEFDDIRFRGKNRFLALYKSSGYRYRYEFLRY